MFKILMDESLIEKVEELSRENVILENKLMFLEKNAEVNYIKKVDALREEMKKALVESDIERERLKEKIKFYEKLFDKLNLNLNFDNNRRRDGENS
jgi:hypothetical protein